MFFLTCKILDLNLQPPQAKKKPGYYLFVFAYLRTRQVITYGNVVLLLEKTCKNVKSVAVVFDVVGNSKSKSYRFDSYSTSVFPFLG